MWSRPILFQDPKDGREYLPDTSGRIPQATRGSSNDDADAKSAHCTSGGIRCSVSSLANGFGGLSGSGKLARKSQGLVDDDRGGCILQVYLSDAYKPTSQGQVERPL